MDIRDNGQFALATEIPQFIEVTAVKTDDARIQTMRIKIVIQNEIKHSRPISKTRSDQKCSAFTRFIPTAFPQLSEQSLPQSGWEGQPMPRRDEAAHSRWN